MVTPARAAARLLRAKSKRRSRRCRSPIGATRAAEEHYVGRRGVYAFPWDDRGWEPRFDHYTLRHPEEDIARLPKIDYSEFDLAS